MRAWTLALVAVQFITVSEAYAQAGYYCSEPSPPRCIDSFGTFDDEWSFDRCRQDIEGYLRDIDSFRSCLLDWSNGAADVAEGTVERFNCKASGETFCP